MKTPSNYLDKYGLVVQSNGDGGDSLNRTCATAILMDMTGKTFLMTERLESLQWADTDLYRRHPDPTKWYCTPDRTSRDQLIPLVILLGSRGAFAPRLRRLFSQHLKRGLLFAWNTRKNFVYESPSDHVKYSTPDVHWDYKPKMPDLTGPEFWALYIRGFKLWALYPLLNLFDLETLMSSAVLRFQRDKDDVINHALVLEYGRTTMPTPVMWLARKLTSRKFLGEKLDRFFGRAEEPPINLLYKLLG